MTIQQTNLIAKIAAVVAGLGLFGLVAFQAHANVTDHGVVSHVASSSLMAVGPGNATTIFANTSGCASRVVTTVGQPVMLSFSTLLTPSGIQGHLQAASTTVVYDNLTYGCGQLSAYGYVATTSITVTQLTQ